MKVFELDTPAVLVNLDITEANLLRAQRQFDALGIRLRPHIKTHKIPALARTQLNLGASGIACQKISEAEVFAAAGCDDILLCYNIMGREKLARLVSLARSVKIAVVADSLAVVEGLSNAFQDEQQPLSVLVECDTGLGRCGVQSPQAAAVLANTIDKAAGLKFGGLMTYPAPNSNAAVQAFLTEARDLCLASVGHCDTISSGGTPTMGTAGEVSIVTEYRPGTYIFNDRSLVERGSCSLADCALSVITRVVSRPTENRAIVDAGSKTLTSDLLGLSGYGLLPDYPGAVVAGLSEEHGHVDLTGCKTKPAVGDLVRIIPNHACPVTNLTDILHFHRGEDVTESVAVVARGRVY